jgi:hypothetical protein
MMDLVKASDMGDVRKKSVLERLNNAKHTAFVRKGRQYNPGLGNWIENAVAQHNDNPFRAIIAGAEHPENDDIIAVDDLDDGNPLFTTANSLEVPRVGNNIADVLTPVLCIAKKIKIVDPFFDLRKPGYLGTLTSMLEQMVDTGVENAIIELHFRTHDTRPSYEFTIGNAQKWVGDAIPEGYRLELHEWRERNGGEDFHDRYLLCDCGGLLLGSGFEATGSHQQVLISRMAREDCQNILRRFNHETAAYDLVQPVLQIDSGGTVTIIGK